jgi:predicted dehydrogenase
MPAARLTRRSLLTRAVAGAAALAVVPRHVLGGPGHTPPSAVLTRVTIGCGLQGLAAHVVANTADAPPVQAAVCDVDQRRLAAAMRKAGRGCAAYADFRRALDRADVDVVVVATPPHWHALISIAAMQAGKDVLCEKPLTRFIREGRVLADAAARYGRILRCNTFGRASPWEKARQAVVGGLLGRPVRATFGPATGFGFKARQTCGPLYSPAETPPPELDFDAWLGPAPLRPYSEALVAGGWRGFWDFDGGGLTDIGSHWADVAQFILGKDEILRFAQNDTHAQNDTRALNDALAAKEDAGAIRVQAVAPWPAHPDACGLWGSVRIAWADGTALVMESGEWGDAAPAVARPVATRPGPAPFLDGPDGRIFFDPRTHRLTADPPGLLDALPSWAAGGPLVTFEDAVRSRSRTPGDTPNAAQAHRGMVLLHLGNIATRTGRTIVWDTAAERIVGDDAAQRMADPPLRAPWRL